MRSSVAVAMASVVLVAGCQRATTEGPSGPSAPSASASLATPSPVPVTDLDSLVLALEVRGYDVRVGDEQPDRLFPVWPDARDLCIGDVRVSAFEFPDETAAEEVRSGISPDGYGIPTGGQSLAHVDWIGPPHFFAGGRVIVLYIPYWRHDPRDEMRTLDALELVLGAQFAGSDEGGRSTDPGPVRDVCMH